MERRSLRLLIVVFISAASVVGCFGGSRPQEDAAMEVPKTFYLDAILGFTIEYPQTWTRTEEHLQRQGNILAWEAPIESSHSGASLSVSTKRHPTDEGIDTIFESYKGKRPGFVLASRKPLVFENENVIAFEYVGHTAGRVFLLRIILSDRRAFIVETAAPPEFFDIYRPLFEDLVGSFLPLN